MSRDKRIAITPLTPDRDGISIAQQTVGAANLTITGAQASGGSATFNAPQLIEIYSAGNLSAVSFTVTGLGQWGVPQSEVVVGPNNAAVGTTKYYTKVTQVAAGAAVGSDVEVGTADELAFVYALDLYNPVHTIAVDISGTINYTLEKTFERLTGNPPPTPNWIAGGIAAGTVDASTAYSASTGGVRLKVNSYTAGATIALQVNPAGHY